LDEGEKSEQKPELNPKSEDSKKKLIGLPSATTMKQWQTFVLAIIIIGAYVIFFAWIIGTSPITKDSHGADVRNYDGMTTLAGTFGVIAAAVVGYYFGTRNLEQATNLAVEAKKESDENKNKLKNELDDSVPSLEKGSKIYDQAKKLVDSIDKIPEPNKKLVLDSFSEQNVDIGEFKKNLDNRIGEVTKKLQTKKLQRDMIR